VLSETLNVLGKRSGRETARRAAEELLSTESQFVLLDITPHIAAANEKFTESHPAVSFTDCLVMAIADFYHAKEFLASTSSLSILVIHELLHQRIGSPWSPEVSFATLSLLRAVI